MYKSIGILSIQEVIHTYINYYAELNFVETSGNEFRIALNDFPAEHIIQSFLQIWSIPRRQTRSVSMSVCTFQAIISNVLNHDTEYVDVL